MSGAVRRNLAGAGLVLTALALFPAGASASRVEVVAGDCSQGCSESMNFTAAPGELNQLRMSRSGFDSVKFEDPGSTISVGRVCQSVDAHTAICNRIPPGSQAIFPAKALVTTGDGRDTVRLDVPDVTLDTGAGDDSVEIRSEVDVTQMNPEFITVHGGPGRDRLIGILGSHHDLFGDAGNDVLRAAPGGQSKLAGGRGNDRLTSGRGADELTGGAGDDTLSGGRGRDRLSGGPGRDSLFGGPGRDVLSGGPGRDRARQ